MGIGRSKNDYEKNQITYKSANKLTKQMLYREHEAKKHT